MDKKQLGNWGEEVACKFLKKQGYRVLERNFLIRGGEIDIVAQEKDTLVFVEVKTRKSASFGTAAESITPFKLNFLIHAAEIYATQHSLNHVPQRIDAVVIDLAQDKAVKDIQLIRNITQ